MGMRGMKVTSGPRIAHLPQLRRLRPGERHELEVVATVLPFKVNNYVVDELIDWDRAPDDPIFRLTFPHRDMLPPEMFEDMSRLMLAGESATSLRARALRWRGLLNPHPDGQVEWNVPSFEGERILGLQHKYRETVLVFPAEGQTCHAYCAYCFRWAQFTSTDAPRLAIADPGLVAAYLERHRMVSDVLFTGGDPMIMASDVLARYVDPLLVPELEHVRNIRIGTKALTYWPYRFTRDPDADDVLRLVERCRRAGRSVSLVAHVTHVRELETDTVVHAVARLQAAGATIRAQAPIVEHVNASADALAAAWKEMVRLGISPYYTFVERDTGARRYFAVPLARAIELHRQAQLRVSGLERTARGPVMSASPGKILLDGELITGDGKAFVCRFLQARNPQWVGLPFLAAWDGAAEWLDDLAPASGDRFFWEDDPVQDWRDTPADVPRRDWRASPPAVTSSARES
jgi:KamA family protein